MFGRIDHVGLAVTDLEAAIDLHVNVYGLALVHRETVTEQGVEAALLDVGENHVELLAPLHDDTPVGKFLAKRGPGLHHVAYQVDDIEAVLRRLRDQGLRLIDESPRAGIRASQVAFLHPSASGGVLTEIVQPAEVHVSMPDPTRKAAVGFQGGQVLALRLSESQLNELRSALREGGDALARGRGGRRRRPGRRRAGRLPARRVRRAPRRLLSTPRQSLRVRAAALDLALYKRLRSLARTPETVRWVRRYSTLGEHAARVARARRRRRAARPRARGRAGSARPRSSACSYLTSSSIKWSIGRPRPTIENLPHLMATPTGPLVPVLALDVLVRRRARVRRAAADRAAVLRAPSRWRSPASTSASTTRPTWPPAPGLGTLLGSFGR